MMHANHTPLAGITVVVMAKDPDAGPVKTRLLEAYGPAATAAIAGAMLRCTVARLLSAGAELVLAVSPDGRAGDLARRLGATDARGVDQGPGNLGERLDREWRGLDRRGLDRPVAFFGGDSPDVPRVAVASIVPALAAAEVAIGPTADGGYWTLAARRHYPGLLTDIDWGGPDVYDQTCQRAVAAGLTCLTVPAWHDIDRPGDLDALRLRLREHVGTGGEPDPPLSDLAGQRERLCSPRPDGTPT